MRNKLGIAFRTAFAVSALVMVSGAQALTLPTVNPCNFGIPGTENLYCYEPSEGVKIYVASQHDDFISFSVNALSQLGSTYGYAGLAEWSKLPSFGSGQIVKLFSFNNSNNDPFPPATNTKDETVNPNGPPKPPLPDSGDQDPTKGNYLGEWPYIESVTVGELREFLDGLDPVFSFDLNNNGGNPLELNGLFEVVRGDEIVARYAFDNEVNSAGNLGLYDSGSLVDVLPKVTVPWDDTTRDETLCPDGKCVMTVDNNVGSGKPDFFAYAPLFDLYSNQYQDSDTLYFMLKMAGLNAGGEELSLAALDQFFVPEPDILALLGLALIGLGMTRRFRKQA